MAQQIQLRRDTGANWTSANPILAVGELGVNLDTGNIKIGDGVTAWNALEYWQGAALPFTSANLDAVGHAVNTLGKIQGTQVFCTTHVRPHWAAGPTAGAVWVDADGVTAHTPA